LIFSIEGHIEKIIAGTKTQTRRPSDKYQVDKFYSIQPGRGKRGISDGKIFIIAKRLEIKTVREWYYVLEDDALAEGDYIPQEYEELYEKMYPKWKHRVAYLFRFYPTKAIEMMERGKFPDFMLSCQKSEKP